MNSNCRPTNLPYPKRTPNAPQTCPKRAPHAPQPCPKRAPNAPQTCPNRAPTAPQTQAEIHEQILAEEGLDLRGKPAEKPTPKAKSKSKAVVKMNVEAQRKYRHEQGIYTDGSEAGSSGEEDSEDEKEVAGPGIEDEDSEEDDPGSYNYSGMSAQDKKRAKLKGKPKAKPSPKAKRSPRGKQGGADAKKRRSR